MQLHHIAVRGDGQLKLGCTYVGVCGCWSEGVCGCFAVYMCMLVCLHGCDGACVCFHQNA